jgi:hypothetical protein
VRSLSAWDITVIGKRYPGEKRESVNNPYQWRKILNRGEYSRVNRILELSNFTGVRGRRMREEREIR